MTDKNLEYSEICNFIGKSSFVEEIKKISKTLASGTACILVSGEQGTGKRLFAKTVHLNGNKDYSDFLEINCCVYSDEEIKKYFSLIKQFPASEKSIKTIYISNINYLSYENQINLLDLIKDNQHYKKGFRFIAGSQVNLEEFMQTSVFLRELYFAISTVPVNMLPLRQRKEDILPIASYYFGINKMKSGKLIDGFSDTAKADMEAAFWNGNITELKNAVERGFIKTEGSFINSENLGFGIVNKEVSLAEKIFADIFEEKAYLNDKSLKTALNTFKKNYVTKILEENNWNQTKTAQTLGIQRTYVIRLIDELQIRRK